MSELGIGCPVCGDERSRIILRNCADRFCGCAGLWSLAECVRCGLVYTVPPLRPDELLKYYPSDYIPYNAPAGLSGRPGGRILRSVVMAPYWLRFGAAQWAARPTGNGKLLDIGCGAGSFLASAAALHWKCHGIDVSPVAIAAAKQRAPMASLRVGGMEELDLDQTNYAFINLSHVLEHLPKPRASLARCFDLLEPGGTLRIVVPNFGGWESRVFGRCWSGLDLPRHLVHFRRSVIRGLLRDVGFEGIADRPAMFASSFSESMILALPEKWRRRGLASRLARWLYLAVIFPASCSYALGNAGALEITARKPRAAGL